MSKFIPFDAQFEYNHDSPIFHREGSCLDESDAQVDRRDTQGIPQRPCMVCADRISWEHQQNLESDLKDAPYIDTIADRYTEDYIDDCGRLTVYLRYPSTEPIDELLSEYGGWFIESVDLRRLRVELVYRGDTSTQEVSVHEA